jgi:hypothetical protein
MIAARSSTDPSRLMRWPPRLRPAEEYWAGTSPEAR